MADLTQSQEVVAPRAESITYCSSTRYVSPIVSNLDGANEGLVDVEPVASHGFSNLFEHIVPRDRKLAGKVCRGGGR